MMTCETPNNLLDPFYPDGNFILNMTDIEQTYIHLISKFPQSQYLYRLEFISSHSVVKITTLLGFT